MELRNDDFEFMAVCHGAKPSKKTESAQVITAEPRSSEPLFGDPEEYKKLSDEEREKQSAKMKGHFKQMFGQLNMAPAGTTGKIQRW
jgi:hypothetical protein